jgi:hypothetical membrane protein
MTFNPLAMINRLNLSGALLFLAGVLAFMGIITAEAFYPITYTTAQNEISDLGATRPPNSLIFQPSAALFKTVMLVAGALVSITNVLQHAFFNKLLFTIPFGLFGLGLVGVGIFPGNIDPYHGLSSMLVFLAGGLSAITAFKICATPFKYFGIALGSVALTAWFFAMFFPAVLFSSIGIGGTERWVAYPILLWLTGLGGYLMESISTEQPKYD